MTARINTFKGIFIMSRPPFHIVGVFPFVLGALYAYRSAGTLDLPVFILSMIAVILIMLMTYYNGEYYDIAEDELAPSMGKNAFSGGSQIIAQKMLPRKYALIGSYISLGLAVIIGLVLQFYFKTGVWTIPLGVIGLFFGFFYSRPPFRWVNRGIGELLIGFSYGWLPIAAAFYLQTSRFDSFIIWMSIPVGLTIFNVIFLNEFPDYDADRTAGNKRNIVVRLGKGKSIKIYIAAQALTWIMFAVSMNIRFSTVATLTAIPFLLISIILMMMAMMKKYLVPRVLEAMCGLGILLNMGVTLAYLMGVIFGGPVV
ncbi:MAG: prenyltransferase [Actinobacteria bacterium]|nr:prenyltransferase [Actinomycetota bacterium]